MLVLQSYRISDLQLVQRLAHHYRYGRCGFHSKLGEFEFKFEFEFSTELEARAHTQEMAGIVSAIHARSEMMKKPAQQRCSAGHESKK
jgi:hypothetical protein